jgi:hypothetical protein
MSVDPNIWSGYVCDVCGKQFDAACKLETHSRSHTGERPFACDQCDKAFTVFSNLKRHYKTVHEKQRPFVCEVCGKGFNQTSNLKRHMKVHPEAMSSSSYSVSGNPEEEIVEETSEPIPEIPSPASTGAVGSGDDVQEDSNGQYPAVPVFFQPNVPFYQPPPAQFIPMAQLNEDSIREFSSIHQPVGGGNFVNYGQFSGQEALPVENQGARISNGNFISFEEVLHEPPVPPTVARVGGSFISLTEALHDDPEEQISTAQRAEQIRRSLMQHAVTEVPVQPVHPEPTHHRRGQFLSLEEVLKDETPEVVIADPLASFPYTRHHANATIVQEHQFPSQVHHSASEEITFTIAEERPTPQERLIDLPAMHGEAYSAGSSHKGISFGAQTPIAVSISSSAKLRLSNTMDSFNMTGVTNGALVQGSGSYNDPALTMTRNISDSPSPFYPH